MKKSLLAAGTLLAALSGVFGQNTLAAYNFDNNATDNSLNQNDGVLFGATSSTDRYNAEASAYQFDGASYIDMGNNSSLDLQEEFTISAWVNRTGSGATQTIVSRGFGNDGDYWLGLVESGGSYFVRAWIDGESFDGTMAVPDGWNHILITWEPGLNGIRFFLNEALTNEFTSTQDLAGTSAFNFRVGNDDQDDDKFFEGQIDEVTVFRKPLTLPEIATLFNSNPLNFTIDRADFGNALHFGDDTNSWVNLPADSIETLRSFSFECWLNYRGDGDPGTSGFFSGFGDGSLAFFGFSLSDSDQNFVINAGGIRFQVDDGTSLQTIELTNPVDIADSFWHHIAVTLDDASNTVTYYVDGEEAASGVFTASFGNFGSMESFILGRDFTTFNYLSGIMDEVRVWNYALSQNEIESRRNIPLSGSEEGLIHYFDFNQGNAGLTNSNETSLIDRASELDGEIFGFTLSGDQSNWVKNDFRETIVSPVINRIVPDASIPGTTVTLFGKNFHPFKAYNKVLFGSNEAEIVNISSNAMEVIVPEGEFGNQNAVSITSSGVSNEINFVRTSNEPKDFSLVRRPVSTSSLASVDVRAADLNNDGNIDLVVSSSVGGEELKIYYNNSSFDLANGTFQQVPFEIAGSENYLSIYTVDINGDGLLDIVGNRDWFENGSWTKHTITTDPIESMYPADLDSDGDIDIVGITNGVDDELFWFENDGAGNFSASQLIASGQLIAFITSNSNGLLVEDIDGDFDMDIILASNSDFDNATSVGAQILINDGKGNFAQKVILQEVTSLGLDWRPSVGDFNGDGRIDIVHGGEFAQPQLFLNDENLDFATNQFVLSANISTVDFENVDLDGDGDQDLLYIQSSQLADSTVWWARNDGMVEGQLSFTSVLIEASLLASVDNIRYADMDNDGDLDVITASSLDNQVTVYNHSFAGNDFTSFSLLEEVTTAIIDSETHTINAVVDNNTALFRLLPEFTVSELASVSVDGVEQTSGSTALDFRLPVTYVVTAENGQAQEWTVTVNSLPQSPLARDASTIRTTSFNANWDAGIGNDYFLVEFSDDIDFTSPTVLDTIRDASSVEVNNLESGRSYWYRIKAGNQWGVSEYSNIIFVEQSLVIADLTFEEFLSESTSEQTDISFGVTGGRNVHEVFIRSRGVLDENFVETRLEPIDGTYSFPVTLSDLDEIGLEFDIEVTDNFKTLFSDRLFIYREDIEGNLPFTSFGGSAGSWQIFSIPYELDDDLIESVFSVLGSTEYKKDWRLVRYQNQEFVDFREGLNRIERGNSYWFNSIQEVEIAVSGRIDPDQTFRMRLAQGWNQIGNPYNVSISWNNIRNSNSIISSVGPAQVFNSGTQQFGEGDVLAPFEGAFVWADNDVEVIISLQEDFVRGRFSDQEGITGSDVDLSEWVFNMGIISNGEYSELIGVGMHSDAKTSKDQFDEMLVPSFASNAEMYTLQSDYFYPKFRTDIRPVSKSQSWLFTFSSQESYGKETFTWKNDQFKNSKAQLWLIDEENGATINLAEQRTYSFKAIGDHQFSLHLTEDKTKKPTPFNLILGDPYPNPSIDKSQISLSLPTASSTYEIQLSLHDLEGRIVTVVASGDFTPGSYHFEIADNVFQELEAGIYFYRFTYLGSDAAPIFKKIVISK